MRLSRLATILTIFLVPSCTTQGNEKSSRCEGPTKLIRVAVEFDAERNSYSFTVENGNKARIRLVILGDSDHNEMQMIPENSPAEIQSPKGWTGEVATQPGIYMHVIWASKQASYDLLPGSKLADFVVILPRTAPRSVPLYSPDGIALQPLEMKTAPFQVYFADGKCSWTRVKIAKSQ
jgi:hypothetical protein